jgi:hypothetical protein
MNYFNELTAVESELIRLESLKHLTTVVSNGIESSTPLEIENSIWQIKDIMSDISEKSYDAFYNLYEKVKYSNGISTLKTNDYIAPKNTELDAIVRGWITNA